MLQSLDITNYRSIARASIQFRPFTMLVGANGSGKSNLLKLLVDLSLRSRYAGHVLPPHFRAHQTASSIGFAASTGAGRLIGPIWHGAALEEFQDIRSFAIDASQIGMDEPLTPRPTVLPNGKGAVQVLDSLKTGDREDLFNSIEAQLREFVPEIEKLSFAPETGAKRLQVRETGIPTPVPVSELSEGTRLVLTILTIVHQERKPSIIGLEDLDRGLHPALFGKVVEVCRTLANAPGGTQIIATTHNPYLVDQFIDDEDSVVLVEKKDGDTTFTSLSERLKDLDRSDEPLGSIWYSGLVGGVPVFPVRHLPKGPSKTGT